MFLENGDPFALSADRLEQIAVMIHEYLPKVETIAMYASIKNVIGKTDEELKRLRMLGGMAVISIDEGCRRRTQGYPEHRLFLGTDHKGVDRRGH